MKRLIEWLSILAGLGVLGGFGSMLAMVVHYEHLTRDLYLSFGISVAVFFGSMMLSVLMFLVRTRYDRVQLRRERSRTPWSNGYE